VRVVRPVTEPVFQQDVSGVVVTTAPSTISIVVPAERDGVVLVLGGRAEFTVSVIEADLAQLMTALLEGEVSYVSSRHPVYGRVLLNVRPTADNQRAPASGRTEPGPRELSLTLPGPGVCRVRFDAGQAVDLVGELDAAWGLLDQGQPG
jgi:hypothetical protein